MPWRKGECKHGEDRSVESESKKETFGKINIKHQQLDRSFGKENSWTTE